MYQKFIWDIHRGIVIALDTYKSWIQLLIILWVYDNIQSLYGYSYI